MTNLFHWYRYCAVAVVVFIASSLRAAVYDNRSWPLYPKPFLLWQATPCARGFLAARAMFLGADEGYVVEDDAGGVYDFWGEYNQVELNAAALKAGLMTESLIPPQYQSIEKLLWSSSGKIALRGCMLETEVWPIEWLSLGGSLFVGNQTADSLRVFEPAVRPVLGEGDRAILIASNDALQKVLQASCTCYRDVALGDMNLFVRGYLRRDYWYKFQHIDFALAFGVLAPTSQRIPMSSPTGLAVGGDGLTGLYAQIDCQAVLKSEMSAGFSLQVCQRLPKSSLWRMPVMAEPTPYGALLNVPARYKPGVTLAFFPYAQVSGLREGFGLAGGYYMVRHFSDSWDVTGDLSVQPNIAVMRERSVWGRDLFTVTAFYDFGFECEAAWYRPLVSLSIDIPWKGPVTERVPRTHAVSVRIESRV